MCADSHLDLTVEYLRSARWLHAFLALELILLVAALVLDSMGTVNTGLGADPDALLAMSGVLGALALFLVVVVAFVVVAIALMDRRDTYVEDPQF